MMNHLWQSTIFAACIGLLTLALRSNRASVRHWLWFAASLKFLIPFALLLSLGRTVEPAAPSVPRAIASAMKQTTAPFTEIAYFAPAPDRFDWTSWILAVWTCGTFIVVAIRLRGVLRIRSLIRASVPLNLSLPVEARSSSGLLEPGVVGLWRPVLLLPAGIQDYLTPEQFDAVIAHELAHVRRRDNLLSAIHMVVEALFWFHPLVWWIGSRLVEERERACDEAVIAEGRNPRDYADAIVNVCKRYVESPLACVSGVTGADLKKRLEAIMLRRVGVRLRFGKRLLLASVAVLAAFIPFLAGVASAQTPRFEVAAIRPTDPDAPAGFRTRQASNGMLNIEGYSLPVLLQLAFGVKAYQITGAPPWVASARYDINAKASDPAAKDLWPLLIPVLEERFQLKVHREPKEMSVYRLTVVRPGKLPETQSDCFDPNGPLPPPRRTAAGQRPLLPCGSAMPMFGFTSRLWGTKVQMTTVASALTDLVQKPVVDRTGIMGVFDLDLQFDRDEILPVPPRPANVPATAPNIFTALQEQLGLKLESARDDVEVIVIDRIEPPSEN